MTVGEWLAYARAQMTAAGNPDADSDARILACGVLSVEPSQIRFASGMPLTGSMEDTLSSRLERRLAGEPTQYIEGEAWFMGLRFRVDRRVLIPRQDTETLCEEALKRLKFIESPDVLDLCTGSGALAVSISKYCPNARVTATDLSADALAVASENACLNGAAVRFLNGDGFSPVRGEKFDLIVCNPPYLSGQDMSDLSPEVRCEPKMALFGGDDGLAFYRRFAAEIKGHLKPGGWAMFEVGMGQAEAALEMMKNAAEAPEFGIIKDLCGIDRVIWIRSAR